MIGALIARKYATLHELQTIYSYTDALDMYEILSVMNYNEWVAHDRIDKKGK